MAEKYSQEEIARMPVAEQYEKAVGEFEAETNMTELEVCRYRRGQLGYEMYHNDIRVEIKIPYKFFNEFIKYAEIFANEIGARGGWPELKVTERVCIFKGKYQGSPIELVLVSYLYDNNFDSIMKMIDYFSGPDAKIPGYDMSQTYMKAMNEGYQESPVELDSSDEQSKADFNDLEKYMLPEFKSKPGYKNN